MVDRDAGPGGLAFVPGKGGSIAIVDVAAPAHPKLLWFRRDEQALSDAETVLPVGGHLLLGARDFFSIDVSNPAQPVFLKKISNRDRIDKINGMVKKGNHVFAACKSGWIDVFDVSDIRAPRLIGALDAWKKHGLEKPHDVDAFGSHIVVVAPNGFGRNPTGQVAVFRVMTREGLLLPVEDWVLESITESKELIGANRVQVSGSFAYVGGSWTPSASQAAGPGPHGRLTVIELSDPGHPRIAASVPFSDLRGPNGLTVAGNMVFIAGGQRIDAIDISDPRHPVKLGSQGFPIIKEGRKTDNAHDLVYRDGYLYASFQSDDTFRILRIINERILALANAR